ncbi:MAG TPA: hypothetical protein VJY34_02290 [Roseiarcus sp.]|nr:hypothetical protein [Roseiarcus sp.]
MKTVELFPPDTHNQKTIRLGHPSEWINPKGGDCDPLLGGSIATGLVSAACMSMPVERQSDLRPPLSPPTPVSYAPRCLPGGREPLDRRRLRSNMVVVGVAGLLVFGSYALAEGQSFPCDPQYSYCYPGYGGYPGGYGGYPGGGHGGWGGFGGYGVQYGGFGGAGVNDGYSGG